MPVLVTILKFRAGLGGTIPWLYSQSGRALCAGTVNTITTKYQVCSRKSYTSPLLLLRKSALPDLAQPLTACMVVRRISQ